MRSVLIALVLAVGLSAQRRFVVDASGTGQFTDLPQAFAVARDGDVFEVLPGTYTPGLVRAGVQVVGRAGCRLRSGYFLVEGLGPQATFTITDFAYATWGPALEFQARGCAGPVVFQGLTSTFNPLFSDWAELVLRVGDSPAVFSHECQWIGKGAVEVLGSTSRLTVTHSTVEGLGPINQSPVSYGYWGLRIADGHVDVIESTVLGAQGSSLPRISGGFAAFVDGGSLRAARSVFRGGMTRVLISTWREPAFLLARHASVQLDPTVVVDPVPGVIGQGTVTRRMIPAVSARSIPSGGTLVPAWSGSLGSSSLLAVSLAAPAVSTPFGTLLLDGPTTSVFYFGPAISAPPGFSVPASTPSGVAVVLQGAVDGASGLELTTAQAIVLR